MVIVLGSGGHSGEMASLIRNINPKRYKHRTYVMSSGDDISASKAEQAESTIQNKHCNRSEPSIPGKIDPETGTWDIRVVPRAREIHQPLYKTPLSSLRCLLGCLIALRDISKTSSVAPLEYPDVIITNGPATAVMFIVAGMILKFLAIAPVWKMKSIYVESFARIHTLSLSGKVLLRIGACDVFLVQWPELAKSINENSARRKVVYEGFLV
jgi:beta-1,4-N-acetylglucosaminyltransferase